MWHIYDDRKYTYLQISFHEDHIGYSRIHGISIMIDLGHVYLQIVFHEDRMEHFQDTWES